jgi:hypothetical protein
MPLFLFRIARYIQLTPRNPMMRMMFQNKLAVLCIVLLLLLTLLDQATTHRSPPSMPGAAFVGDRAMKTTALLLAATTTTTTKSQYKSLLGQLRDRLRYRDQVLLLVTPQQATAAVQPPLYRPTVIRNRSRIQRLQEQ